MTNVNPINELEDMLRDANKEINFKSDILRDAPTMSNKELQDAIDYCIDTVSNENTNIEIRERVQKEARVLALMALRRGR